MRGNKRALELLQDLGDLPEQLAGDWHGRGVLAPGGGGNGGGRFGWRAEERQEGFYMLLSAPRVTKG
jgi:hypothetical protein